MENIGRMRMKIRVLNKRKLAEDIGENSRSE